jgi:hypothetical protein
LTTTDGEILEDISAMDADSQIELFIPKGTVVKNKYGQALVSLRITPQENQAAGPGSIMIGQPFVIEPDGATFNGPATLIIRYSDSEVPAGFPVDKLYIALWDPATLTWIDLGGTVDAGAGTVSVEIDHLSTYALMGHNRPADLVVTNYTLTPEEVAPGGMVTASIDVENQGDLTGSYQANLILDDSLVQTKNVSVTGGSIEKITFDIILSTAGEHRISLGGTVRTLVVKPPPAAASFSADELKINPVSVNVGEKADISIYIKNSGDLAGTYPVTLTVDDVAVATREVSLGGGGSMTLTFSYSSDVVGQHRVTVAGLEGVLEVRPSPPTLAPEEPALTLDSFTTTPVYDENTQTLVAVKVEYLVTRDWTSLPDTALMMTVVRDGVLLEQVPLFALAELQDDGKTGVLNYVPPAGWEAGEYFFQATLSDGENVVQDSLLHSLVVTSDAVTKVVSWWTLGAVVGTAAVMIIVLLTIIVYRRRDMLRY